MPLTTSPTVGPMRASIEAALERIHLGLGYEYDPEVVEALIRSVRTTAAHLTPVPARREGPGTRVCRGPRA